MKILLACVALCTIVSVLPLSAADYVINAPNDLSTLDHGQYAIWGVNWTLPQGETITSATVRFYTLYNWDRYDTDNVLYVNLLDSAAPGVVKLSDSVPGNQFAGVGVLLGSYTDPDGPITKEFKTFDVPTASLSLLADGNFGIGIDGDCHFYNCGVDILIKTRVGESSVPEPASLGALCCGMTGLFGFVRRRRMS